jgi:hypothetical protein
MVPYPVIAVVAEVFSKQYTRTQIGESVELPSDQNILPLCKAVRGYLNLNTALMHNESMRKVCAALRQWWN